MKKWTTIWMLVLGLLGCDQRRHVGDLTPRPSEMLGDGVQFQNLVARVTRTYDCPAGRISNIDDSPGCGCNTSLSCDFAGGVPCTCDPGCVDARPNIQCADYSFTFVLQNGSLKHISRMTELRLTLGELEFFHAGLECDNSDWRLPAGGSSGIHEVNFRYDTASHFRFADPSLRYSCSSSGDPRNVNRTSEYLGEPMPPATTSGSVMIEVRGLFDDAAPWKLEAAVDL